MNIFILYQKKIRAKYIFGMAAWMSECIKSFKNFIPFI